MLKKTVVLGSFLSVLFTDSTMAQAPCFKSGFLVGGDAQRPEAFKGRMKGGLPEAPGFASGSTSHAAGLIGVMGGYRFIFDQGATFGMDVAANGMPGNGLKKRFSPSRSLFDNRLNRDFNVVPSFSFGKIIYDQLHIALGLGLGITQKYQDDTVAKDLNVSSSQTTLGFVPSVGAEYAWTKNISFIGNVSYERYRKVNSIVGQKMDPALSSSRYWSAIKPKFLAPKAGIIYRF